MFLSALAGGTAQFNANLLATYDSAQIVGMVGVASAEHAAT